MKEVEAIIDILKLNTETGVLATLVKVEGSSYRRTGARLLWRPHAPRVGSISGGCLEEDLVERARAVHQSSRADVIVYDTTSENDLVWGVGLGCHGIVNVLLEPITGFPEQWRVVNDAWQRREPAVIGSAFGLSSASRGALAAISASGTAWFSCPEPPQRWIDEARRALVSQKSHYTEEKREQGTFPVLWEFLPPPLRLVIFGAGDDALPLARLAKELGWNVVVADPRAAYATKARFSMADEVHVLAPEKVATLQWDPLCIAVVMTHHYRFDVPILRAILPLGLAYVGLLGPKKRAEKIIEDLQSQGVTVSAEARARLHAPVGLDLGGSSPEEVALAIAAEIQAEMAKREARPLRDRTRPIHG